MHTKIAPAASAAPVPVNSIPFAATLDEDTITDTEIAHAYGKSRATVRRWAALGRLPPKVGPGREPRRNRAAVRRMLSGAA